jgi:hypothetical protein
MTPAAQVFSASQILQEILNGKNANYLLQKWGKENRFAGSRIDAQSETLYMMP